MGIRLIKIAVVYLVIGVLFGMYMSITKNFEYASLHTHINLLGWASLGIAGLIYYNFPDAGNSVLGKMHFWFHNIGLPVMMVGLFLYDIKIDNTEPVIATGGVLVVVGIIILLINIFKNVKQ